MAGSPGEQGKALLNRVARSLIALGLLFGAEASQLTLAAYQSQPFTPLPAPALTIGTEGNPDYEFVRISAVRRLPAGEIVVTDGQTPTIRVFGADGRLLRRLGRNGEGPGEFRAVSSLMVLNDTLVAYDWNLRRITRYLVTGKLEGTQLVRTDATAGGVFVTDRLSDGRWLVTTLHSPSWANGPGVFRDTSRVGTIAASSTGGVTWTGAFPGATFFANMPKDKSDWIVGWLFFAPSSSVAALADTIVLGDTGVPELRYLRPDGQLIRRVTLPLDPAPDLGKHRAAYLEEQLEHARSPGHSAYLRASSAAERPGPRYRSFLLAPDGMIWVHLYEDLPGAESRYLVLSPAGAVRARVSLPPRTEIHSVQLPYIMVVLKDENDVERVGIVRWQLP